MALVFALPFAAACGGSPVPPARFANAPVATIVDDRRDVPKQPAERDFLPNAYFFDASIRVPVERALTLPRHRRALGVNAADDVPDSTWFTNRISTHALTTDQVRNGPVTHDPGKHLPFTITSSKFGGTTAGFIVKDRAGVKYLLKFDAKGDPPEMETGTHVACNRLLWAVGYNVAEDQIMYLRPEELVVGKGAKKKDDLGHEIGPLTQRDYEDTMKLVRHETNGKVRALVSRWIGGKTIGGHTSDGTRDDDPNDIIPHELRRDLRGLKTVDAWLDAVDVTEGQFVDSYVEDPAIKGRHYVVHYAIDFGKSLGAMGTIAHDWWRSYSWRIDFPSIFRELFLLGLDDRWWERPGAPPLRGVSNLYDVKTLQPDHWHSDMPGYIAHLEADKYDEFWATKVIGSFTRAQIHAAVEAAKFTDPRATDYLTDTLVGRQRKLQEYWFARVAPLDKLAVESGGLCFDDLAIGAGLAAAGSTKFRVTGYDYRGDVLGPSLEVAAAGTGARTCVAGLAQARAHEGYTIYRVETLREAYAGTTFVHVAIDPKTAVARVVGIWRP